MKVTQVTQDAKERYAAGYQAGVVHALIQVVEFFEARNEQVPYGISDAVLELIDNSSSKTYKV